MNPEQLEFVFRLPSKGKDCIFWPFKKVPAKLTRFVCAVHHGPPFPEQQTLHTCRNDSTQYPYQCIAPYHLYWGFSDDNVRDRMRDARTEARLRGEEPGKLEEDVAEFARRIVGSQF